jgi:drug/metabolite transporter (DMT)-like permease
MAELIALLAAACFGLGTVLMQRGTLQTEASAAEVSFYLQILRRPAWLLGIAVNGVGAICQILALDRGALTVVQPIITLSLVFALPFGAWLSAQHIGRREVIGALVVVAGLAVFLTVAQPHGGIDQPSAGAWLVGAGAVAAGTVVAILASRRRRPSVTAGLLGVAAGACYGMVAALLKEFTTYAPQGVAEILTRWTTYALILASLVAGILQQAALKTGVLPPAMSAINVTNLLVSVALGALVFQETMSHGGGRLVVSMAALVATGLGVVVLMRGQTGPRSDSGEGPPGPEPVAACA